MIIARIQSLLPELRPSERRVAELVLAQPTLTAGASIKVIAAAAGASEPTVIRFCRAVGCAGVQDLKRQIARDLGRHTPPRLPEVPGLGLPLLAAQIVEQAFEALYEVRRLSVRPIMADATALLQRSHTLYLWGFADAARPAEAAAEAFSREGWVTQASADPLRQAAHARAAQPGALVAAISLAGPRAPETSELTPGLRAMKAAGAATLLLGPEAAPAARLADVVLPLSPAGGDWPSAISARTVAVHTLLEVLRQGALLAREQAATAPSSRES